MSDFIKKEGISTGLAPLPQGLNRSVITKASEHCVQMAKSDRSCFILTDYLMSSGINPAIRAADDCLVFDVDAYQETSISQAALESTQHFCGVRDVIYFNKTLNNIPIIHFPADNKAYRLLSHFYSILHFTDPAIENYVKRFVRDFLHYHDAIYCAAGKIVKALQYEGLQRGHTVDEEGAGGYSALHIRRGDLQ
jgi:GDP-fucose protein O-fucosyltransferase